LGDQQNALRQNDNTMARLPFKYVWHKIDEGNLNGEVLDVGPFCQTNEGAHEILFESNGSTAEGFPKGIARINGKCRHTVMMCMDWNEGTACWFISKKCLNQRVRQPPAAAGVKKV
jgi:hypothetical protein